MSALLQSMALAAETTGSSLRDRPLPVRGRDFAALRAAFEAVDAPATALLREHLPHRPGAAWADEFDAVPGTGEVWVVDAVDGAVQYLQGLPQWCVSVALVRDGEPVAAVLHAPASGETFTAERGGGARLNGAPCAPSGRDDPRAALVATSQPPFDAARPAEAGRSLTAVLPHVAAVRNLGATSWQLADVAAGRLDGFWQHGRDDANLLPGVLIAREAGVRVTGLAGAPWRAGETGVLAAPAQLHPKLLALL
ncbi:inositol monophosphatase family protein [Actinomadura flavalba]|uniref:inositol monophosphatase family protein n=1 Tax=Actinomadura flavalba TaxID=1120938 RepID=UPI00196A1102|nr:inositol monophosphatase [Actinomadura flavalba]